MIPKTACKDRSLYRVRSRNLTFGVYNARLGAFLGVRHKWGNVFVDVEYHYDNGPPHGTVEPLEDLSEELPMHIVPEGFCTYRDEANDAALFQWLRDMEAKYGASR